jgi:hypothetical protein
MWFVKLTAVVCFAFVGTAAVYADKPDGVVGRHAEPTTLLGTLEEWKYPGSKMPEGATMSGNGPYPPMQFVTCQTVLTTPDSMEKVVDFYSKKFKSVPDKSSQSGKDVKIGDAQSVVVQEDSKGRPVAVRVIAVNRAQTSTTLVISRSEGERQTHIAWVHFMRIGEGQ